MAAASLDALLAGAVRLSSGMDYLPSRFGGVEEVADIALPLAAAGRPYVSHLRAYGPGVRAGLVASERQGLLAYYYLLPGALKELSAWLS